MGALPKENQYFTYADYKAWDLAEGERYELIYGEAYPMFAAPSAMAALSLYHQAVLGALYTQLRNYLQGIFGYKSDEIIPVATLPGLNISLEQVFEE